MAADPDVVKGMIVESGFTGRDWESCGGGSCRQSARGNFAAAVLLCEGPTDVALLEGVAALQGGLTARDRGRRLHLEVSYSDRDWRARPTSDSLLRAL